MKSNKWDPFKDLFSVHERMNRLFENTVAGGKDSRDPVSTGAWSPAVDVYETEEEFIVEAEIPEVERPDVDIKVENDTLTIEGERKLNNTVMEGYHRIERNYGRFSRSFVLSGSVDKDSIKASLKDGVLRIILPKKGRTVSRKIQISGT